MQQKLICILGPTAVGKTALAIQLAKALQTHIISADSRQFYKEISIGTAKPLEFELAQVPHHFINNKSITETYNAGDFERDALLKLEELFKQHQTVIAVGGSGLYIKALLHGLDDMPKANEPLRAELNQLYKTEGIQSLQQKLLELDPDTYSTTELENPQRVMRAIEIALAMQQGFVAQTNKQPRNFSTTSIVLNLPREVLYQRINTRVDDMIQAGLVAEAERVKEYRHTYALRTVGYTELYEYMDGKHTLPQAIELIKQHTRNFAKRQLTWFKKEAPQHWFEPTDFEQILNLVLKP
jgi:tRNA dimethylallyltransferase